ncbi:hypothetical protein BDZ89DRAFT_1111979 [Hymenopellis radicata]|nr:hypothetical protein BDZ89DRAFT_1111979 [Hymenopellis radicata]
MGRSHERHHLGAYYRRVIALSTAKDTAGLTTPLIITRTYPQKPSIRLILGADADLDLFQLGFMDALGILRDEFDLGLRFSFKWSVQRRFHRCARSASFSVLGSPRFLPFSATLHFNLRTTMDVELLLVHDE